MSFAPGTMFRSYTADQSKHYTAVLLKDGKVLEVKNPETGIKTTFDSFDAWQASHPDCTLKIDESKSFGVVMTSINDGFNYPNEKHRAYRWIQWCYSIVKEAAPQLLNSEEFKLAYNNMVALCTKHKKGLYDYHNYHSNVDRYEPKNITINKKLNTYGYPAYFKTEVYQHSYFPRQLNSPQYSKEEYKQACIDIGTAYEALINIIKPQIESYMTKKFNIFNTRQNINYSRAAINRYVKKINRLKDTIKQYETYIKNKTDNIDKLELQLLAAKTAVINLN